MCCACVCADVSVSVCVFACVPVCVYVVARRARRGKACEFKITHNLKLGLAGAPTPRAALSRQLVFRDTCHSAARNRHLPLFQSSQCALPQRSQPIPTVGVNTFDWRRCAVVQHICANQGLTSCACLLGRRVRCVARCSKIQKCRRKKKRNMFFFWRQGSLHASDSGGLPYQPSHALQPPVHAAVLRKSPQLTPRREAAQQGSAAPDRRRFCTPLPNLNTVNIRSVGIHFIIERAQ